MESEIRKRSSNFTSQEETRLVSLAKKYKSILECKTSNTQVHQQKSECWIAIEKEFNSSSGEVFRPKNVLRKKYDNIKKKVKKKFADEKCYIKGTGGGPPKNIVITDVDNNIKEMLGVRIDGRSSEFDGDSEFAEINNNIVGTYIIQDELQEMSEIEESVNEADAFIVDDNYLGPSINIENQPIENKLTHEKKVDSGDNDIKDWSKCSAKLLRSKKSSVLQLEKGRDKRTDETVSGRVSQWAAAKSAVEDAKKKFLEEENNLKLQFMKEKHELELLLMKKQVEFEMELKKEEHNLKIEILELQKAKLKK